MSVRISGLAVLAAAVAAVCSLTACEVNTPAPALAPVRGPAATDATGGATAAA